jgi:hypothetical protein
MAELTLAKRWTLALADARAREAAADKLSLLKRQIWNVGKYLLVMNQSCQSLATPTDSLSPCENFLEG